VSSCSSCTAANKEVNSTAEAPFLCGEPAIQRGNKDVVVLSCRSWSRCVDGMQGLVSSANRHQVVGMQIARRCMDWIGKPSLCFLIERLQPSSRRPLHFFIFDRRVPTWQRVSIVFRKGCRDSSSKNDDEKKNAIVSSAHGGDCNSLPEKMSATKTRCLGSCRLFKALNRVSFNFFK